MAVLRIYKKQQNFVILDKTCLNDEKLSWGAKGLHAYLMSLPDDWQVRVSDLRLRSTNGRDAVRGLLSELEQSGYIQKAACRDNGNGRFGGIEYLVLEVPDQEKLAISPETEKPSLVKNEQKEPRPENPFTANPETGNPAPVSATLISINRINNNKLSNKTAASTEVFAETASTVVQQQQAAAVTSFQAVQENVMPVKKIELEQSPLNFVHQDALITSQLTQTQKQRINTLVNSLNIPQKEDLTEEIEFCLLNPKHFTACGHDFGRKLNAIRKVILRNEWQTPVGMMSIVVEKQDNQRVAVKQLETELKNVYAEASHFKKLLANAKAQARDHIESILKQVNNKIQLIESQVREMSQNEAAFLR
jgi:hypothetical protein